MAPSLRKISGKTSTRMSVPPSSRHFRATARGQTSTPLFTVDMCFLRQILLRGAAPGLPLRPATQEPDKQSRRRGMSSGLLRYNAVPGADRARRTERQWRS